MLDSKFIRQNKEKVKKAVKDRGFDPQIVNEWFDLDKKWRNLVSETDSLRLERNKLVEKIKLAKGKPKDGELKKGKELKEQIKEKEKELSEIEKQLQEALFSIPNLPADDVPAGKNEENNVEIKKWGEILQFDFKIKDHLEIGEDLGIIDVKRAAKVSGSRFGYFKGDGALLELGLIWYVFEKLAQKGFIPVIPPVIVKKDVERALGYAEHGGWDQAYVFEKEGMVFISSSEHSVLPMHQGEIIKKEDLPLRYVNFSTCFRRESGTYGKDTHGVFRVHQFNKVEINVYTLPDLEISDQECLNLLAIQEEIMQSLKLPYRVVHCCTGDIPFPNRRMYDLETWFPGQKRYRETHSCSNCTDFQMRRLNIKVETDKGKQFVHALNATAVTDRIVIAILENFQTKEGSVLVPEVLQKYVRKKVIGK